MKAEIISIGTELLLGDIPDTNSQYLAKKLSALGIDLYFQNTVGDNPERLAFLLKQALKRSDIVITTGGLGPTVDDITLETIAAVSECRLILKNKILSGIKKHFRERNLIMPSINKRQAYIPQGATALENKKGTAPAIVLEEKGKLLISLPGPPFELIPLFEGKVMPILKKKFALKELILSRTLKITGLTESAVSEKIIDLLKLKPPLTLGIYAHMAEVDLKITAKEKNKKSAFKKIATIEKIILGRLGKHVFGKDSETLEACVGKLLYSNKKTVSVAESCTGGLISSRITDVPGSSRYFPLSIIVYSNREKTKLLGIPNELIKKQGAVSKKVASLMASNIRKIAHSDIGLGVTGIAGPSGNTLVKKVGLVYIALSSREKTEVKEFHFIGERKEIKFKTSAAALDMVRCHLLEKSNIKYRK
ncbi:MAG: competence/damage-inducible protein A [Candidatus Omnitrophica bacterium]|nr:competence/damage-inducible protein A [Candidatus Omnitrophota bacterium]